MNTSTLTGHYTAFNFNANPNAQELSQAATSEIEKMRTQGVSAEIITGVEKPMRTIVELMTTYDQERLRVMSTPASSDTDKQTQLNRLIADTRGKMVAFVEGLRYDNRAAQLESELFKGADDAKGGDSLLDFLQQQEIRQILRARDPEIVVKTYAAAIESGNGLVARAIESDPLADLIPVAALRAVRQQRAELANPVLAKKLSDIRAAQSAMWALVPALPTLTGGRKIANTAPEPSVS